MKKIIFPLLLLVPMHLMAADSSPRTTKIFFDDGGYVLSSPLRVSNYDWPKLLAASALIGGAAMLDRTVRDHLAPFSESSSAKGLRTFGDVGQLAGPIIGTGFALQGWASGNEKSKDTAFLAYDSFVWAGASELILKPIIGRARPSTTDDPFEFKFGRSNASFPSGHTTTAFAAATVFAEQYPQWYVVVPSYAGAGLVGYSRLAANQHWLSDVVGGAILGIVVSHVLIGRFRRRKNYAWHFETNGSNLKLVRRF